ncbi:MAG: Uma2 family endonuclease [Mycobacterium leprae]
MRTIILDPLPKEIAAFVERRRALGQDTYDEVWDGVYHMAPAPSGEHAALQHTLSEMLGVIARRVGLTPSGPFNLGDPNDYRVPDLGYHRAPPRGAWVPTAAVVVEILSPGDETFEKFGFYAAHDVDEIVVADLSTQTMRCWHLVSSGYREQEGSAVLDVDMRALGEAIEWPREPDTGRE